METTNMKILLVDDEKDIIEFLKYNFEKEGFKVYTAQNGSEGKQVAKKVKPDLIILDIMMPGMDGVELCQELRALPEFEDTLIVFLTARGEDYSQIAGFEVGADDYITKPVRPKVLIARVKALLKRKSKGSIVENKRLGAAFEWIAAQQRQRDAEKLANPKVSLREKKRIREEEK